MTNIGGPLGGLIECTVHLFHLLPISTFRASSMEPGTAVACTSTEYQQASRITSPYHPHKIYYGQLLT